MKIWAKTVEFSEGKYLVVRRDGTIPPWPHFVIGADDPNAPAALRGYAAEAEKNNLDADYVASLRELAAEWEQRPPGKADPDAPPHRTDNPAIIKLMRGEGDLTHLSAARSMIDNETRRAGEVCTQLQDWIDHHVPGGSTRPYVTLTLTEYTTAIEIAGILLWECQNACEEELAFEELKRRFQAEVKALAVFA